MFQDHNPNHNNDRYEYDSMTATVIIKNEMVMKVMNIIPITTMIILLSRASSW